jgi:hypothetical protein
MRSFSMKVAGVSLEVGRLKISPYFSHEFFLFMHLILKNASFIFKKINIQFYYYIQKQKNNSKNHSEFFRISFDDKNDNK